MPRKNVKLNSARLSNGRRARTKEMIGNRIPKSIMNHATIVGGVGLLTSRGVAPQYFWFGLMIFPFVMMLCGYRIRYKNEEEEVTFGRDDGERNG